MLRRDRLVELLEQRPEPTRDLHRRRAVPADLGDAERDVLVPAAGRHEHATGGAADRSRDSKSAEPTTCSRSPRWLSTCTAVVGSLIAGESALIAMSTMIRTAKAGSCSIVRSTPWRDHAVELPLGVRATDVGAVGLNEPPSAGTKSPTTWLRTSVQRCSPREPKEPVDMNRLDRARRRARTVRLGCRATRATRARSPAHPAARQREHRLDRPLARAADECRNRDGAQAVDATVEEEEEEEQIRRHQSPGDRDAEVRDRVLLDAREQREGERERADQHREQDVQHAVAVPEPEVAGREAAGRHLHDEDADRDDEARERRCRADDRREQVGGRRRRVLEVLGDADLRRRSGASTTEDRARDPTEQRQEPEAPLQVLARLEEERPHAPTISVPGSAGAHHLFRLNDAKRSSRRDDVGRHAAH